MLDATAPRAQLEAMRLLLCLLIPLLWATSLVSGCEDDEGPSAPADATYTVRGRVDTVPPPDAETPELAITHEEIPDFVDREGKTVGMHAMRMRFGVSPDVQLGSVQAGTPVRFTFEVRWNDSPMLYVTSLEPLPEGTELELEGGEHGGGHGEGEGGDHAGH